MNNKTISIPIFKIFDLEKVQPTEIIKLNIIGLELYADLEIIKYIDGENIDTKSEEDFNRLISTNNLNELRNGLNDFSEIKLIYSSIINAINDKIKECNPLIIRTTK